MRTIKFKGKCKDGAWHYGVPVFRSVGNKERCYIVSGVVDCDYDAITIEKWQEVIPETVGQFTGLLDKNGKEIYEGDILNKTAGMYQELWQNAEVCYSEPSFGLSIQSEVRGICTEFGWNEYEEEFEITGNIHDK